ncbi:Phenylalanyl-tRNA synthetase, beta subunit, cytoplasmic [Coemansia spiralis]|uniref:phenylalanine--tRNA ligase n=2 Tax=Coemansia TaxID=4863 RepID=A0ABQ8PPW2_9FUNG|nr:alpha subunit of cytoplasmic phenylalanyl-tRNA synthetase [Coemansia spiralis]KAJ1993532.1 Phenylalanyl-tRNA synthetase, beta subunit, cytoplasmic [Coemansia umbellata]KAJ2625225.1 Phenylalanyl-tRNA synthetase, beta subunit, cytoplasmic [Coemansia sp. RSA 1358]KAJ2677931.1 Phenylalanyl-tRNA synthetase, beta subunit, cytoplasmic [Coemansia spiralis]
MSKDLRLDILNKLDSDGSISDTSATFKDVSIESIIGALKSLEIQEKVGYKTLTAEMWSIEPEGKDQLENGSYEARIFHAVPAGDRGIAIDELKAKYGNIANLGQGKGLRNKWLKKDGNNIVRLVDGVVDQTKLDLEIVNKTSTHPSKDVLKDLKRRNLIKSNKVLSYAVHKGANFSTELKKQSTDLTVEMLHSGEWKTAEFKKFNFDSMGVSPNGGHLHPLMKVRSELRQIFFEMGFEEMPTNDFVESSFWNFDALFVPQQHPARELQDTFFLNDPAMAQSLPDFWESVKDVHEVGGYGSIGYRCKWSEEEAKRLVLRTHTTAVSSHVLNKLAQEPYRPAKYFSIDRVYRNEATDATHLAEFHQVEGVIADKNMSLGSLINFLDVFFRKMGLKNLRFKPAYNPYTEPSMEIFCWHEGFGKWIEIGNSGIFRPEMLRPLGLEEGVQVAGFGLSLERPTTIIYGINDIRKLVGHKVDLGMVTTKAACRLDKMMGKESA